MYSQRALLKHTELSGNMKNFKKKMLLIKGLTLCILSLIILFSYTSHLFIT